MRVTTQVCRGLAAEWPALAAGGPLLASPGWLRAMDGRLGGQMLTFLVGHSGQPALLAALATVHTTPAPGEIFDLHHVLVGPATGLPLTDAARARRASLAERAPAPSRWTPNLLVMLPGYECVPVGPGAGEAPVLDALVHATLDFAAEQGLRAVAYLYTRPGAVELSAALRGHGFVPVPLSLHWDLPVPPGGLAEHLSRLPRKRRTEATRELQRLRDAGVVLQDASVGAAGEGRVLAGGDGEGLLAELTRLRCQLVEKYRGRADERMERRRLLRLVSDVAAGRPRVLTATAGEVMVGFALFAAHEPQDGQREWHCLSVGYDYDDPRSRLAYFATAYYAAVDAAAAAGVASIGYGHGSAAAKRARGCVGTTMVGWVHTSDEELAAAVRTSAAITELQPAG